MEKTIELFGYLILAFLGVVAPILTILLSIFREGILKLTTQYENEKSQSEKNIKEQLKKIGEAAETDVAAIEQSLKQLKTSKKMAETKLSYLNPKKQILWLFIPLFISFLGVIFAILTTANIYYMILFLAISSISFIYTMFVLWRLFGVIIEVRKIIDDANKETGLKAIELLSILVEKTGGQNFLKNVYIKINDKAIKNDGAELTISTNEQQKLKIEITNSETKMAKNIEIGFVFPSDFIVEKKGYYSVYTGEAEQIVRYEKDSIHGHTNLILQSLFITPLKEGSYKIKTFIKAENIEATYRDLNLNVILRTPVLKGI